MFQRLILPGSIEQPVQNIVARQGLFRAGLFAFLVNFILDVIIS